MASWLPGCMAGCMAAWLAECACTKSWMVACEAAREAGLAGLLDGWLAGSGRQYLKAEVVLEDLKDWYTCPTEVATQTIHSYPCMETGTNASTPAYEHSGPAWSYRPFAKTSPSSPPTPGRGRPGWRNNCRGPCSARLCAARGRSRGPPCAPRTPSGSQ